MSKASDILEEAKEKNVRFIRLQFTDLFGSLKNVEIPTSQLEKALNNEMMFDGSSIEGFTRIEESDMYLYPDHDTWLVFPWVIEGDKRVARLICDVYTPDGVPFTGDPRGILKRVIEKAKNAGFTSINVGPEPEFFLFKENGEVNDNGGYFDLSPMDTAENCRRDIVLRLEEMGFEVEASHHEVAEGQHEIDFKYDDALNTADNIQTFKYTVKNVAASHNMHANFMPKPLFGVNGSGMHCHISFFQGENNAFYDAEDSLGLSSVARSFLAGVLYHAKATAAVTNPTVNSYKRLVAGYEAPVNIAWSPQNRSCMVRIPASRGMGTRIEVRNPDPAANPYLALAALIGAGLDGIQRNLMLGPSQEANLYTLSEEEKAAKGIDHLPRDLSCAISEFKNSDLMKTLLGEHAFSHYTSGKMTEWDAYRLNVSDWEKKRYRDL